MSGKFGGKTQNTEHRTENREIQMFTNRRNRYPRNCLHAAHVAHQVWSESTIQIGGNCWVAVGRLISKQARGKICYAKIATEWQKIILGEHTAYRENKLRLFCVRINLCIFMSLYRKLFACCLLMPAARIFFRASFLAVTIFLFLSVSVYFLISIQLFWKKKMWQTVFKICRRNYLNWKLFV